MRHRQDDTPLRHDSLHVCDACDRDFIVPVSVVDLLDHDRCIVELTCTNCGISSLGVHDDRTLMELDRRMDEAQLQISEAVEILEAIDEWERVEAFAQAIHDDHILPEDF